MILYFFIILILFFLFYKKEGFNLRSKNYDSFFEENNIINDKTNTTLTYQDKTVKYGKMNLNIINSKSTMKKIFIENGIPSANYYLWKPELSSNDNLNNILFLSRPLVIKPDKGEKGILVTTNVIEDNAIVKKVNELLKLKQNVLIEEQIQGLKEYRITILNDTIIGATEKKAAFIIGDNNHTIDELIIIYNKPLNHKMHTVDYDYMKQQGYEKHDILPYGIRLTLTNVANMSNGSQINEIDLNTIHPINVLLFKNLNHILDYTVSGIDYLGDLSIPYLLMGYVIEVNSRPSVDIHYSVVKDKKIFLKSIVNNLFGIKII